MKKVPLILLLTFMLLLLLASCGHEHAFGEWSIEKEATCTDDGVKARLCECGEKETEAIAAKGHVNGEWKIYEEATCTTYGTKHLLCSVCNATINTENVPMLDHTEGLWVTDKEPTCTEDGSKHQICSVCSSTIKTESIEAKGHSYSNATCTEAKKCTRCSETSGSALGHSYSNATCTEAKKCTRCGETSGSALGHNYVESSSTNGHLVGSVITYCCNVCNNTTTETIKSLTLHVYQSSAASINGWFSSVGYTANASGGYGKYEYKFEVFLTENSKSPALTNDFSENNYIGWTSRYYCNGNMLIVTLRDEAGNITTEKIIVE